MALATDIDPATLSNIRSRVERACQPFFDNDRVRSGAAVTPFLAVNIHGQQSTPPLAALDNNRDAAAATPSSMSSGVGGNNVGAGTPPAFNLGPMPVATTVAFPQVTKLFPEQDVVPLENQNGQYWYNPKTFATSWKKEELVETNKRFYERVRNIPSKSTRMTGWETSYYWKWSNNDGVCHTRWTLQELWSLVRSEGLR